MRVYIKGLNACVMRNQKLAQYRSFLEANGHLITDAPPKAEAIILWTCAFRADHRDASIETIKKTLNNYNAVVIAAGCLPAIAGAYLPKNKKLILAYWNNEIKYFDKIFKTKKSLSEFSDVFVEKRLCKDAAEYRQETGRDATFHDQFIKLVVSEGCNFKCAYCSERLAFPPYKSVPPEELERNCRKIMKETDVFDVILLADSLGQYGCDIGTDLFELIKRLSMIDKRVKFAFNNLHLRNFIDFFDKFKQLIIEKRVRHFNLPIQSASDFILKKMNRNYNKAEIQKVFGLFKSLSFNDFDTHIIIGFPCERESDVDETIELLTTYKPRYVLASRYMETDGADSAKLTPKVSEDVALLRLKRVYTALTKASIICNCDGGELSRERIKKLHNLENGG